MCRLVDFSVPLGLKRNKLFLGTFNILDATAKIDFLQDRHILEALFIFESLILFFMEC